MNDLEIEKWRHPCGQAYEAQIQHHHRHTGQQGPLDICNPHKRRFLFPSPVRTGTAIDWGMLSIQWRCPYPVPRIACQVGEVGAAGRAAPAWKKVEKQMEAQRSRCEENRSSGRWRGPPKALCGRR